jgi:hypothetical protein
MLEATLICTLRIIGRKQGELLRIDSSIPIVLYHRRVCDEESSDAQASTRKAEQSAHVANDTDTNHAVWFAIPVMRIHLVD